MYVDSKKEELNGHFFGTKGMAWKEVDKDERNSSSELGIVQELSIKLEEGGKVEKDVAHVHEDLGFDVWIRSEKRRKRTTHILHQKEFVGSHRRGLSCHLENRMGKKLRSLLSAGWNEIVLWFRTIVCLRGESPLIRRRSKRGSGATMDEKGKC